MIIDCETANQAWERLVEEIIHSGMTVAPRKDKTKELRGNTLIIRNPRHRIVADAWSAVLPRMWGRAIWEIAGRDDAKTMQYYDHATLRYATGGIENGVIQSAYGHRMLQHVPGLIALLKSDRDSRRAYIPVIHPTDEYETRGEYPCISSMQFLLRNDKLHCLVTMRSSNVLRLFPQDVFVFTLFQEYVATLLGVDVGEYTQFTVSAHLYTREIEKIREFPRLSCGEMRPIRVNEWDMLIDVERKLREDQPYLLPEWDEARQAGLILLAYAFYKRKDVVTIPCGLRKDYEDLLRRRIV